MLVETRRLDAALVTDADRARELREAADYDAVAVPHDAAEAVIGQAERFVATVRELVGNTE